VSEAHDRSSEFVDGPSGGGAPRVPARPAGPTQIEECIGLDVLSDVLLTVRLTGAVFFPLQVSAPWADAIPAGATLAQLVGPQVQHVLSYHIVTRGSCWARIPGAPAVRLQPYDVLVVPHGDSYVMSSAPDGCSRTTVEEALAFLRQMASATAPALPMEAADDPNGAQLVCGFLGCDLRPFNPLLGNLPRLVHLSAASASARERIAHLVDFALSESHRPRRGAHCVLLRLSELLFVEALRLYLESLPAQQKGWLAGLRDPVVARALALLHERPAEPWTLARLASASGASRSVLAERFADFVDLPPMRYLASWRIQLGATLLADPTAKVAAVALQVGYDSEAAFSRAFKKLVGKSPSAWRRRPTID
jgi:AraC-like DNA-binding protein